MAEVRIAIMTLPHGAGLALPAYATAHSAGLDLPAAISEEIEIAPMGRLLIPTGFAIALPEGYEAQVRPRSGLAFKAGLTVLNAPGTIDADYRGEVMVLLINLGELPATLRRGDRIAQMVVAPVARVSWEERSSLDETQRADGGYGSTGLAARAIGA
jgi:dUTP pyrophosphatase